MRSYRPLLGYICAAFAAGCATSAHLAPPQVPAELRPAAGQTLFLAAVGTGVQIYECTQNAELTYQWTFKAPEASLKSPSGQDLGRHYAGPTWESIDGSTVVGVIKARDPGPIATAIPWLLLDAKTTTGAGTFAGTKSIQRVATAGGTAPVDPCNSTNVKQVVRVPYHANYYFYH
jgi:hypothetical protein